MGAAIEPEGPSGFKSFTSYGVLGRWNPSVVGPSHAQPHSKTAEPKVDARVTELTIAVRVHKWPLVVAEYFQYNGRLTVHLFQSSGWYQQDEIEARALAIRGWIDRITDE